MQKMDKIILLLMECISCDSASVLDESFAPQCIVGLTSFFVTVVSDAD